MTILNLTYYAYKDAGLLELPIGEQNINLNLENESLLNELAETMVNIFLSVSDKENIQIDNSKLHIKKIGNAFILVYYNLEITKEIPECQKVCPIVIDIIDEEYFNNLNDDFNCNDCIDCNESNESNESNEPNEYDQYNQYDKYDGSDEYYSQINIEEIPISDFINEYNKNNYIKNKLDSIKNDYINLEFGKLEKQAIQINSICDLEYLHENNKYLIIKEYLGIYEYNNHLYLLVNAQNLEENTNPTYSFITEHGILKYNSEKINKILSVLTNTFSSKGSDSYANF